MVWFGRDTFHLTRLLKVPFNQALNTSSDEASTPSLGILFQCLATLTAKNFFLIHSLNLLFRTKVITPWGVFAPTCCRCCQNISCWFRGSTECLCGTASSPYHMRMLASLRALWYLNTVITDNIFSLKLLENLNARKTMGPSCQCRKDMRLDHGCLL